MRPFGVCLWFTDEAEEASAFYTCVLPDTRVTGMSHYGPDAGGGMPEATVMVVNLEMQGHPLMLLNGGKQPWSFNESISLVVNADSQEESDRIWTALCEGGEPTQCGWLKDRFGVSWQVVPDGLDALLSDPDPDRAYRAMQAMLQMQRLDLAAMRAAADGS